MLTDSRHIETSPSSVNPELVHYVCGLGRRRLIVAEGGVVCVSFWSSLLLSLTFPFFWSPTTQCSRPHSRVGSEALEFFTSLRRLYRLKVQDPTSQRCSREPWIVDTTPDTGFPAAPASRCAWAASSRLGWQKGFAKRKLYIIFTMYIYIYAYTYTYT